MSCPCIPCNALNHDDTPPLRVETSRISEIPKDVWHLIFSHLDVGSQIASSITCKRWRHILSKILIHHPNYNIGTFNCFKTFYTQFLQSRHVILLDATCSMTIKSRLANGSLIIRKLLDFLEPVIKARGLYVGALNHKITIKHVKKERAACSFFNRIIPAANPYDYFLIARRIQEKITTLKAKLPTHVHVISDMEIPYVRFIFDYSCDTDLTYHFYSVDSRFVSFFLPKLVETPKFEGDPLEPENKKRKVGKEVTFCIHPLNVKKTGEIQGNGDKFYIPPKAK